MSHQLRFALLFVLLILASLSNFSSISQGVINPNTCPPPTPARSIAMINERETPGYSTNISLSTPIEIDSIISLPPPEAIGATFVITSSQGNGGEWQNVPAPDNIAYAPFIVCGRQREANIFGHRTLVSFSNQIIVNNVAPTADLQANQTQIMAGETVTLSMIDIVEPSPIDRQSLQFSFDCDTSDGRIWDVTQSALPQTDCTYDQPGTYRVRAQIRDKDGGQSEDEMTISVAERRQALCNGDLFSPATDLSGNLTGTSSGIVTNHSTDCSYPVGLAVYLMVDNVIDNQILYDYVDNVIVSASGEITLTTGRPLPECAIQVDLFYGDLLPSLNGVRYGQRLLAGHQHTDRPFCLGTEGDDPSIEVGTVSTSTITTPAFNGCFFSDNRINADPLRDCIPPIAVYCQNGGVDIWRVDVQTSQGEHWLTISTETIEQVGIPTEDNIMLGERDNVLVFRLTTGELQVNTWSYDPYQPNNGKPYVVRWEGC